MIEKVTLCILLGFALVMAGCKKEETVVESDPGPTIVEQTEAKIRHNWGFNYTVLNIFVPNPDTDTIHGQTGDYYIFQTNNLAYSSWGGFQDTVSYKVLSSNTMMYGGDTMYINTLNTTKFVFTKTTKTDTSHYENVIELSR